jgi:sulfur-oxidizing protein SoxY
MATRMKHGPDHKGTNRRNLMAGAIAAGASLAGIGMVTIRPATATPASMQAAIKKVVGDAPLRKGKVALDLPPLVENGNTVPLTVAVESPMTATDYVKAIHIFNEKNPQPNVIDIRLGPRAGKATVSTRIKLADEQTVVAIAQMSDGSFWSDSTNVIVTIAACVEDPH